MDENVIHELIHEIGGYKVMLDFDLARLYGVTTDQSQIPGGVLHEKP